ncbi:MAG: dethiobiotin synthase [Planctomycetes bacterium]|nr:dethiobiotin synthase [Planctomycetota bacterium]
MGNLKLPPLQKPGLFITAVDTDIGKTVITCAIAASLRRRVSKVGVCKPIASGCRHEREGLVSDDAEALAHFADCRMALDIINPVRYHAPLAPSTAAQKTGHPVDMAMIDHAMCRLDEAHDVMLVEGVGGLMVPLDDAHSVLDLAKRFDYPVVVVTHTKLGTLNHTALTCAAIRSAGLRLAGLVLNRYDPDTTDDAQMTNPAQLVKQNRTTILATVPACEDVAAANGEIPAAILEAVDMNDWLDIAARPRVR